MAISQELKKDTDLSTLLIDDNHVNYIELAGRDSLDLFEVVGREVRDRSLFPARGVDFQVKISVEPGLRDGEKFVGKTLSVCNECRSLIRAVILERSNKIWIRKACPDHGVMEEIYWGDAQFYYLKRQEANEGLGIENPYVDIVNACPFNCGLCGRHRSHTALLNLVVTNRCHLGCWYCLPADEEVLFKIDGRVGLYKLGDIANKYDFKYRVEIDGFNGEYSVPDNLYVPVYEDGYVKWSKVNKLLRRKYRGRILRISTRTGREIRLTPEHKVYVLNKDFLEKKKAGDLVKGDKIIVMRNISSILYGIDYIQNLDLVQEFSNLLPNEQRKIYAHSFSDMGFDAVRKLRNKYRDAVYWWRNDNNLPLDAYIDSGLVETVELSRDATRIRIPSKINLTPELGKLIGYFVADGHYTYKDIRITVNKKEVERDIINILKKLGFSYSFIKSNVRSKQIVIGSRNLRLLFKDVFRIPAGASRKRLPTQFMHFPRDVKIGLLSGLFNGDGYVSRGKKHIYIGYASVSKALIRDILYLLAELDIFARVYKIPKSKMRNANHDLYKIYIAGSDMIKLLDFLDLAPHHKRKLGKIDKRRDPRIVEFGDFFIDEVREITEDEYSGYVYDVEVSSSSHNFIASDGLVISNCFFYAQAAGYVYEPTLTHIKFMLAVARRQRPIPAKAVQITGGEPTMREDLVEIIRIAKELGYEHVQLNTTGITFIYNPDLAKKVREAGVNTIYLSFDGVTPLTNPKNHWEIPYILDILRSVGMGAVLVPTVTRSGNLHEVGDMIRFGLKFNDIIRGVNFQPISLVGRVPRRERERLRVTIPDVLRAIEEQLDGQVRMEDWYTVPITIPISRFVQAITGRPQFTMSNHFACGTATYVMQDRKTGKITALPQFVDVYGLFQYLEDLADYVNKGGSKKIALLRLLYKLNSFVDWEKTPEQLRKRKRLLRIIYKIFVKHDYSALSEFHYNSLFLGMMHFMDEYNYDVARVERCDIHYVTPDGRVVPFCTFNVFPEIYRDKAQTAYSISISDYLKGRGLKSLSAERYRRNIRKLEEGEPYRRYYEGFWDPTSLSYEEKKRISMRFGVPVVED